MTLKTGSLIFLVNESHESKFGISSFFIISEINLFNVSAASDSDVASFQFQLDFFFFLILLISSPWILTESKSFTVFRNLLFSITFSLSHPNFDITILNLCKREAHIYFFFIHKPCNFLLFSFVKRGS